MSQKVDDKVLNNEESLKKLVCHIRDMPAFWQGAQRDLLACVQQLGVPMWFCSFSSADMNWKNLLHSILKQEGRRITMG